jgi:uncharacterized metal-binding protein
MTSKVLIIPCSGIGKCYGSVARESAFIVVEDLCPEKAQLLPLSLLVLGEEDVRQQLSSNPAITIDGCKLACAAKVVSESGGTVAHGVMVLDVHRRHRDLKPAGIAELDKQGLKLAQFLAEEVNELVETMTREDKDAAASQ